MRFISSMQVPFLFAPALDTAEREVILDEDQSRHAVQVLRLRQGDPVGLTDGKGCSAQARIQAHDKRACTVQVEAMTRIPPPAKQIRIAISLLKHPGRFEWFLEKATEIGVSAIIPLQCERTARDHFRYNRMQQVIVSALLQSQQAWMPVLTAPVAFEMLGEQLMENENRLIAHCMAGPRQPLPLVGKAEAATVLMLIGPEGDFTPGELEQAVRWGCKPVYIGESRLRTETAGIVAAAVLRIV